MSEPAPARDLRFLFRSDQGTIDQREWWRGVGILAATTIAFVAGWWLLSPYANRGLDERQLIDAMTIVTYLYLMIYAFSVILVAVCYVNLSIKRLRAVQAPTGLAGLLPFMVLVTGAAHWLQPRVSDTMPWAVVGFCDLALVAVALWAVVELGVRDSTAV